MRFLIIPLILLLVSCRYSSIDNEPILIKTMIRGSTEHPDPVLKKVLALEKEGLLFNLTILESFPLQLQFEATQEIIDEVKAATQIN